MSAKDPGLSCPSPRHLFSCAMVGGGGRRGWGTRCLLLLSTLPDPTQLLARGRGREREREDACLRLWSPNQDTVGACAALIKTLVCDCEARTDRRVTAVAGAAGVHVAGFVYSPTLLPANLRGLPHPCCAHLARRVLAPLQLPTFPSPPRPLSHLSLAVRRHADDDDVE